MKCLIISFILILLISHDIKAQQFDPGFFCFEDAFLLSPEYPFDSQAKLLKNLGFDGLELEGLDRADEKLTIIDKYDLRLFMVYIQIDLEKDQPYDVRLNDFIKKVQNRGVTLWLHIHSDKFAPSDTLGDKFGVPLIQKLADYAATYKVNIALYPHSRFWLEKVDDAVRLTEKINRRNVGAVFNLCHFLKTDDRKALEKKLIRSIPYLSAVSLNGADDGATGELEWSRLIQPLGKGTFDTKSVLQVLKDNNYKGPVGLQCYNIEGEPSDFLKISIDTWKRYIKELSSK
jgi:sugar phosphate isomerase/epimerase